MENLLNIFLSLGVALVFTFLSYCYFQTIQLGNYTCQRFFKNAFKRDILTYVQYIIVTILSIGLYFAFLRYKYISFIAFFAMNTALIIFLLKHSKKTPLKLTKRMFRQTLTFFLMCFGLLYFCFNFAFFYLGFIVQCILPFIALLSLYIMLPLENLNRKRIKKKSEHKLLKHKNTIVIGITGSFGKTAVKNYLYKMLKLKYAVLATPKSYNTPMGIANCILSGLTDLTEIFICEMGARHKGDIRELCNMVKPTYALICTIGNQHLETFKTLENIKSEKYELAKFVKEHDGISFFNGDNDIGLELFNLYEGEKYLCNNKCAYENSLKNSKTKINYNEFAYANIFEEGSCGVRFELCIDGLKTKCETKLLGRHNIDNIVLAAACAYKLGVPVEKIAFAISNLESVPHRLQLIKSRNNVTVIDDSYNSNTQGFNFALQTLVKFSGRKILVTPGIVELGNIQYDENFKLAKNIFMVCDFVIIVGLENSKAFKDGFEKCGFKNFILSENLKTAQKVLQNFLTAGDTVLFENDLPDNY